jgi:hypothetical protein
LEASRRQLALACLQHNGALQVFDRRVAGRGSVASRSEGERELPCARGVLAASSPHVRELERRGMDVRSGAASRPR